MERGRTTLHLRRPIPIPIPLLRLPLLLRLRVLLRAQFPANPARHRRARMRQVVRTLTLHFTQIQFVFLLRRVDSVQHLPGSMPMPMPMPVSTMTTTTTYRRRRHRPTNLHRRRLRAQVKADFHIRVFARQIQIPIRRRDKQAPAHDISQRRRNQALPDIVADPERTAARENRRGDEEHVRDDVVEGQGDEGGSGPPDRDDLGHHFARRDGEEDGEAN